MYTTGEKPGKGKYKCLKCGKIVTLENDSDSLPICPVCKHDKWEKL
ncbi:hypothetical protein QA597_01380 [Marinilabiliaceae bacterium ANBcel2]|nr:hypothetical protein [Marinilabiliaceae bacterium ANBcel2]